MFGIATVPDTQMGLLKIFAALVAVGSGILNPSLSSLISQVAGPRERGETMGVQQGLGSFARMIAPPLGTGMMEVKSFGTPFGLPYYVGALLMAIAFFLSLNIKPISAPDV
jgi:MFS family permease